MGQQHLTSMILIFCKDSISMLVVIVMSDTIKLDYCYRFDSDMKCESNYDIITTASQNKRLINGDSFVCAKRSAQQTCYHM